MPHQPPHAGTIQGGPCTWNDFYHWAKWHVAPAYMGVQGGALGPYHPTYMANFNSGFLNWVNDMWIMFNGPLGCNMFQNRYTHWNNQVVGPPPITNAYMLARKKAKMTWAQTMHQVCGCSGPIPSLTGGVSNSSIPNNPKNSISESGEQRSNYKINK